MELGGQQWPKDFNYNNLRAYKAKGELQAAIENSKNSVIAHYFPALWETIKKAEEI